MKKTVIIFVSLIVTIGLGLAAWLYVHPKKALSIVIPKINQVSHVHINLLQDTARIDADLAIRNDGFFKLHIDSLGYHIGLDTATFLSGVRFVNVQLARGQADTLKLPLALPYLRLMKEIKSLQGRDSVDIPIKLRIVYSTVFGRTELPYHKVLRIEVPHPPKFEIEKIEYIRREKKTGFFMARLAIHNYGKINLDVSQLHYRLTAKELFVAEGIEKKTVRIRPKTTEYVDLPVKVEFKSVFKTIRHLIWKNDKINYRLKITGFIQKDKLAGQKTAIEVEKSGVMALRK